ncbi:hypothetical protein BpHYR1_003571 [Brachionus plicatilis]|uniref:Uncharacterized protein n=1 Tax=Brachionus plicatilis TaxID=10195 RepID=A0A3M7Q3L3_BRAPC|nr:hypothetical protein BpHYR1_003571 [Brachionus plicatilis]
MTERCIIETTRSCDLKHVILWGDATFKVQVRLYLSLNQIGLVDSFFKNVRIADTLCHRIQRAPVSCCSLTCYHRYSCRCSLSLLA